MDFNYMELVTLGITYGLIAGVVIPLTGKGLNFAFRLLKVN